MVSVGVTEQDILLQLGVVPVGVTEWYGEQPDATWPWAHDLLEGAQPEVLSQSDGLEFEKIAALEPDLIVGTNAGLTEKDYELLSAIAPTVTSVEGSTQYFSPWQDQVLQIARALGREADGQAIIDEVDDEYADGRRGAPGVGGHDRDVLAGRPVRRPPLRLPGRPQHRLPHRPRLHDDAGPGGVRPRRGLAGRDLGRERRPDRRRRRRLRHRGAGEVRRSSRSSAPSARCRPSPRTAPSTPTRSSPAPSTSTPRWPRVRPRAGSRRCSSRPPPARPRSPTRSDSPRTTLTRSTMNPTRRRFLAGLSVLAVAPVLAACGSDDSDAPSGSRLGRACLDGRGGGVPGHDHAQVRRDHDRDGAEAGRLRRPHRAGRPDGARRRAGRRHLLVRRREAPGHLPVGPGGPRRRRAARPCSTTPTASRSRRSPRWRRT